MIGPEVSVKAAAALRKQRDIAGLTREQLSRELAAQGYEMSAATIQHIEAGVREKENNYQRLLTLDEIHAFIMVFGAGFAEEIFGIITEGISG
jgi:transcriptional regulator with XRE-family HTH domain